MAAVHIITSSVWVQFVHVQAVSVWVLVLGNHRSKHIILAIYTVHGTYIMQFWCQLLCINCQQHTGDSGINICKSFKVFHQFFNGKWITSVCACTRLWTLSDFIPVHLPHWLSAAPNCLPSVTELFRLPLLVSGTVCLILSLLHLL